MNKLINGLRWFSILPTALLGYFFAIWGTYYFSSWLLSDINWLNVLLGFVTSFWGGGAFIIIGSRCCPIKAYRNFVSIVLIIIASLCIGIFLAIVFTNPVYETTRGLYLTTVLSSYFGAIVGWISEMRPYLDYIRESARNDEIDRTYNKLKI